MSGTRCVSRRLPDALAEVRAIRDDVERRVGVLVPKLDAGLSGG